MGLPQIREGTTLLEFYRQLVNGAPIVNGKQLDCAVTVAGGTTQRFAHGLGRAYRGAWVMGTDLPATIVGVQFPELAEEPRLDVELLLSPASTGTVRLWVW